MLLAEVSADANILKVVLDNLLSNAFQYTESGEVNIAFKDKTLTTSDSGPGIEQTIYRHITDAGVKGHQSSGFGFGLAIVKRLCEHQGWEMDVTGNKGTTVTIAFAG